MGATNRTQNYNLPQFVGSDKPTWLGDVNGAMSTIDTQMKANNELGTTANTTANTALQNAGTAQGIGEQALEKANSAEEIGTSALTKALSNEQKINLFNLTNFETINYQNINTNYGAVDTNSKITIAKNNDGSLAKIYGTINISNIINISQQIVNTIQTSLRPESDIVVECNAILRRYDLNYNIKDVSPLLAMTIKTTGEITFTYNIDGNYSAGRIMAIPVLLFIKDFGDTPINP